MINWEDKVEMDKTWATYKSYFKELYAKQKKYNKETGEI